MPTSLERQRAFRRGHLAETAAAWLLRCKGYRIVARRVRTPMGEIDLIARRGRTTAFVEVKERPSRTAALEAVTAPGPPTRRCSALLAGAAAQAVDRRRLAL